MKLSKYWKIQKKEKGSDRKMATGQNTQKGRSFLAALALVSSLGLSLVLASQANLAWACGGSSGCGGNTVTVDGKEIPFATYLSRSKLTGQKMEGFQARVAASLDGLRSRGLNDFANELERGFSEFNWYMLDRPLDQLGFLSTRIPFQTNQMVRQDGPHVFIEEQRFNNLFPGLDRTAIFQELLERIYNSGKNINTSISELNVALAADLLGAESLPSGDELRAKLKKLGFVTENMQLGTPISDMDEEMGIAMELAKPISLTQAREVTAYCEFGPDARSIAKQLQRQTFPEFNNVGSWSWSGTGRNWEARFNGGGSSPTLSPTSGVSSYIVDPNNRDAITSFSMATFEQGYNVGRSQTFPKDSHGAQENMQLILKKPLNRFSYRAVGSDPAFLKWGKVNEERKLEAIHLMVNRKAWQGNGIVQMYGGDGNVEVPAVVNIHDYANCLREEFAKASVAAANPTETAAGVNAGSREHGKVTGAGPSTADGPAVPLAPVRDGT